MARGAARTRRLVRPGRPRITGTDVSIGADVTFGPDVQILSARVRIGDGCHIGQGVRIEATTFDLGDFGTIYPGCFFPGPGTLRIGHNFWLGMGAIVDAQGGTTIGNNVGIGAQSQLWTHIKYGDVMAGSRFHDERPLTIGDDVWLVGHCLVSPVDIGPRAMAMLGAVITKDLAPDRTYAGSPARDMTDVFGPQFEPTSRQHREEYLRVRLDEFARQSDAKARYVAGLSLDDPDAPQSIDLEQRTYRKTGTPLERELIRFLLPDAKLTPVA